MTGSRTICLVRLGWRLNKVKGTSALMDIVAILKSAVERLPQGSHSSGLTAVLRHIDSAIRHFERDEIDLDCFTDTIYRTNQAFEGSLKEAYRVLADKDPSGMSPHQIESYLEQNNIIRSRVLTQLTRYRQDYRNPSTHDHKLDFDEDEALLAIVAVCAFAKLLVDQISEKIAFDLATPSKALEEKIDDLHTLKRTILKETQMYAQKSHFSSNSSEFIGGLAGTVSSDDIDVLTDYKYPDSDLDWDIYIKRGDWSAVFEVRGVGEVLTEKNLYCVSYVYLGMKEQGIDTGIIILRGDGSAKYKLYKNMRNDAEIFLVSRLPLAEINAASGVRGKFELVR